MDHMGVLLAAANANRDRDALVATQQYKHRHREWDAVRKAKKRKTHDGSSFTRLSAVSLGRTKRRPNSGPMV